MFTGTMSLFLGLEPKRCKVFLVLGLKFIIMSAEPFPPTKNVSSRWTVYKARIHASIHGCMQASIHPCIYPSIHTSIHAFIHPCLYPYIHSSIYASIDLCIQPSIHTLVYPSIHPIDIFIEHLLWGLVLWSDEQNICSSCLQGVYNLERDTDLKTNKQTNYKWIYRTANFEKPSETQTRALWESERRWDLAEMKV